MKKNLDNKSLLKYSRQIILKDVGVIGQKKIINSKVLVIGAGGLGSPVIDLLARAGVGQIGVIEFDKISYQIGFIGKTFLSLWPMWGLRLIVKS